MSKLGTTTKSRILNVTAYPRPAVSADVVTTIKGKSERLRAIQEFIDELIMSTAQ